MGKDEFDKALENAQGQRNEAWKQRRLGKITASKCKVWMQKGRSKNDLFGVTCINYLMGVLAEIATGNQHETGPFTQTQWGEDFEQEALKAYSEKTGNVIEQSGFVQWEHNPLFGGSPDGRVANKKIVEAKCPFDPANTIKTFLAKKPYNDDHLFQCNANMIFFGVDQCDYIVYDPRMTKESMKCQIIVLDKDLKLEPLIIERISEITEFIVPLIQDLKAIK